MDLDDIRLFVKVAERRSFAKAAEDLRIQNSMLSRRIIRLEAALGVRLLQRTTRRVSLTEEGSRFFAEAKHGLTQLHAAVDSMQAVHGAAQGTLRISSPIDIGQFLVPPVLPGFLATYPDVHVEWDMISFDENLMEKGFDVTIQAVLPVEQSLITRRLGWLPLQAYRSPNLDLKLKKKPAPEELEALPWLQFVRGPITSQRGHIDLVIGGTAQELYPGNVVFRSNSLGTIRDMIVNGTGVGILPEPMAAPELKRGTIVPLAPEHVSGVNIEFFAGYPSREYLAPKVRVFLDWLVAKSPLLKGDPA